jgi:excisionase family DNA binding protein
MSIPEAARRLGFTLKYVYDLVQAGKLPAEKVDGKWRIQTDSVEALVAKRRTAAE